MDSVDAVGNIDVASGRDEVLSVELGHDWYQLTLSQRWRITRKGTRKDAQ